MSHEDSHVRKVRLTFVRKFRILRELCIRNLANDREYNGTSEQVRQEFR